MNRIWIFLCFLCIPWAARGQSAYEWRYWFDDAKSQQQTGQGSGEAFSIAADAAALDEGLHAIHVQIADTAGRFSPPQTRLFYHVKERVVENLSYWFDDEQQLCQHIETPKGPVWVDVSALGDGFHTVHFLTGEHRLSNVTSRWFIKIPQMIGSPDMTCICTVNEKMAGQQRVPSKGGVISWDLDVSALPVGLHRAVFQVITASGAASTIAERFFVRAITPAEVGQMKCIYTLDNSATKAEAGTMAGGLFHFDLDVSALEDGLHRIAYMMVAEDGSTTPQQTAFFWKTPVGGNGIVQYDYWLNDEEQALRSVHLDKRENPFRLISLLPIDAQPLRSSSFHFEVVNGQPTIYAKNDLHIRFYDTAARCLSDTRQFVDYQMGQKVTDVETLEPNVTATTDKPTENSIKWYKLTAERGDSLSFKTSAACTVQLFAPSGNEVYNASGSEVVVWGGIHSEESGTYYVALHDVTAAQATTVSLDYERIDRYAVLRQDVVTVGNGGPSTITFQGNGFDELTSVDLVLGSTTIASAEIKAEGKATADVKWNFTNVPLGQYKAVFHFKEGNVTVERCIIVEQAKDIELATTVSYPSTFLLGTSTTYTIKIANKGNMTAYDVPIYVYFSTPSSEGIRRIELSGNSVKNLSNSQFSYELSEEAVAAWKESEKTKGLLAYLIEGEEISEDTGDSAIIRNGYIWQDVKPNSSMTITVRVHSTQQVYAWFTVPEDWITGGGSTNVFMSRKAKFVKTDIDCINERTESYRVFARANATGFLNSRSVTKPSSSPTWSFSKNPECPNGPNGGGGSTPVNSLDPNDIYGYEDENGDRTIRDGRTQVYYTIEFENDPEFATASAHDIYVTDVLSAELFDFSTFAPTRIKIGDKEVELNGEKNGTTTIDMRTEINAIAQVEWSLDEKTGTAHWHISSLDPMTMEPSDDPMVGVLPVNVNGNGIGQVSFDIELKPGLPDGTEIPNRATIVFDGNEGIETPTWVNTIGASVVPGDVNGDGEINEVDAQQILDVAVGLKDISDLAVPSAISVPGGNDNALEVNAQLVLDYAVATVKPW